MKNIFLSFAIFIIAFNNLCSQTSCYPDGITFSTQNQIDSFLINHPNCTKIGGKVTISGSDITSLKACEYNLIVIYG